MCRGCNCVGCHNDVVHHEQRQKAMQLTLDRDSAAFRPKVWFHKNNKIIPKIYYNNKNNNNHNNNNKTTTTTTTTTTITTTTTTITYNYTIRTYINKQLQQQQTNNNDKLITLSKNHEQRFKTTTNS